MEDHFVATGSRRRRTDPCNCLGGHGEIVHAANSLDANGLSLTLPATGRRWPTGRLHISPCSAVTYAPRRPLRARCSAPGVPEVPRRAPGVYGVWLRCISHEGRPSWEIHRRHTVGTRHRHRSGPRVEPRFHEPVGHSSWENPRRRTSGRSTEDRATLQNCLGCSVGQEARRVL